MECHAQYYYNEEEEEATWGNWEKSVLAASGDLGGNWFGDVDELPAPRVITSRELSRALEVYAEADLLSDFGTVYGHFLDYVEHHLICPRESLAYPVCRLTGLPKSEDGSLYGPELILAFEAGRVQGKAEILGEPADPKAMNDLRKSLDKGNESKSEYQIAMGLANGIRVEPTLLPDRQDVRDGVRTYAPTEATLSVQLSWRCSPHALAAAVGEILPTLRSAVYSASLLSTGARAFERL